MIRHRRDRYMTNKMIIIKGDKVQGVGYRPFLLEKAVRLKIKYFDAVNIPQESGIDSIKQILEVYVSGEVKQISEFIEFAKSEKGHPKMAQVDSVVSDDYTDDIITIEEYKSILSSEQQSKTVQGGLLIAHILQNETNKNLELLRKETTENFRQMDLKYKLISEGMFLLANKIDKRMEKLEERNKIVDMRMEKTEKSIEELLKILVSKK